MPDKVSVGVVGLNFGSQFVPIYQRHPDVESVAVCEPNEEKRNAVADQFGIADRFASLEEMLDAGACDAVHLFTPAYLHAEMSVAALEAGCHCACAVPVAFDLDGIRNVIAAQRDSGKNYMMMETMVYTRQFFYVQGLIERGELGEITFLRGIYYQDLEGEYPTYWKGVPPMHYATHAVGPILALAKTRAAKVCCFGSGRLRADLQQPGKNTFPLETAIFQLADLPIAAEVTRSWFQIARPYTEAFSVYGDKRGFDWQMENEDPTVYTMQPLQPGHWGRQMTAERISPPDRPDLLPAQIAEFTNGGHHGSHPHLAHEFIRSIVESRPPRVDVYTAADWTAPGICAHESALRGGEPVEIPDWRSG